MQKIPEEVTDYLAHTDDPCLIPKVVDWLEHKLLKFFENTPVEQVEVRFNEFEQDFMHFIQELEDQGLTKTPVTEDGILVDKILVALHHIKVQIKAGMGDLDNLLGNQWNSPEGQDVEEQVPGTLQQLDAYLVKFVTSDIPPTNEDKEIIKKCYEVLQPYLAQVNKNYYTNDLLKDAPDYQKILQKILIQDRTTLIAKIKAGALNNMFHHVLSKGTPELQRVIDALTTNIIPRHDLEQISHRFRQALEAERLTRPPSTPEGVLADKVLVALRQVEAINVDMAELDNLLGNQWHVPKGQQGKKPVAGVLQKLDTYIAKKRTPLTPVDKETIKNHYKELQPYLAQVDESYYTEDLFNQPPDYEQILSRILIQDRTTLIAKIKESKINNVFHHVLSKGTPELQREIGELVATIIALPEFPAEMTEEQVDAMKRKAALQELIEGVKKLPVPSHDSTASRQLVQDKESFVVALEGTLPLLLDVGATPEKLQKLLKSVQALYAALINVGVGSRDLIVEKLQRLQSDAAAIILLADDAEFALGLKPGALSSVLTKQVDKFLEELVKHAQTPLSKQEILTLLAGNDVLSTRLEHEKGRLETLRTQTGDMTPTRRIEIRIAEERVDYLTKLKKEKEIANNKKFEQLKQETFETIVDQDIRDLVNQHMGVYAKQFFQDIKQLIGERKEAILGSIGQNVLVEQTLRNQLTDLFVEVMKAPPAPMPEEAESMESTLQQIKTLYEQANVDLKAIEEVENQFRGKKSNPLTQEILAKFDAFKKGVEAFGNQAFPKADEAGKTVYREALQEHTRFVRSFRNRLDNYQLLVNKDNLSNYAELQKEKEELLKKSSNEMSDAVRQKIAYLNTYETHLVDKCEHGSKRDVANEMNAFVETLNLYDVLIEVSVNIKKLTAQLSEDIPKLTKPVDRTKLEIKKQQLAVAIDIQSKIGQDDMPVQQKINDLKRFMVDQRQNHQAIYKDDFGKVMHKNLSALNEYTTIEGRKYTFFSSYVRNVTPELLLAKIGKMLTELEGKTSKSDLHKTAVLSAARHMLKDGSGSKEELTEVMRQHPEYNTFFGSSTVKDLMNQVLQCLDTQESRARLG
ncbi:synaptonemal complex protein 1 [Legionella tunisiensis]|uniref:hypothetical protein n=1 Tax=Legionella tunisiensis TaxID=1034944 RepID=UPI0002D55C13|nr:hypothetical protein [Legionella tunisiensis]